MFEIGSNDGTCLKFNNLIGCKVIGVDPAEIPVRFNQNGIKTFNEFFTNTTVKYVKMNLVNLT